MNNVLTLGVGHSVEHPAEAGGQRAVLEVVDVCELLLDPGLQLPLHTLVVLLGALREQILGARRVDPVPVEVVRLEELCPELLLRHLPGHVLHVLPPHRRVRLEYGLDNVRRQIVLQPIRAVSLEKRFLYLMNDI